MPVDPVPSVGGNAYHSNMVRVAVAEDHRMVRSALRRFFAHEPGFGWVGEAEDAEEALLLVLTRHVDVLVLDLLMPRPGGLTMLPRLRAAAPDLRVVVFSAFPAAEFARTALELGASAYVEKGADLDVLLAAVRSAMVEPATTA